MRIVCDGSIKLVLYNYNPNAVENPCDESQDGSTNAFARYSGETYTSYFNTNFVDLKYIGYMYSPSGTVASESYTQAQTNEVNSTIKDNIEIWYNNNLLSYSDMLADTLWCNDREIHSGLGYANNNTFYKAYNRLQTNNAPSLKCSQKNDRFTVSDKKHGNGKGGAKVGLLTADEVVFAGNAWDSISSSYYLTKNTGYYWWTSTPSFSGGYVFVFYVSGDGFFGDDYNTDESGLRPSISLKSNTKITGLGTSSNPYKVTD